MSPFRSCPLIARCNMRRRTFSRRGFTLVELLTILVVISLLIGVTTIRITRSIESGQTSATRASLLTAYKSVLAYHANEEESFADTTRLLAHLDEDAIEAELLLAEAQATSDPDTIGVFVYDTGRSIYLKRTQADGTTSWVRYVASLGQSAGEMSTSWDGSPASIPTSGDLFSQGPAGDFLGTGDSLTAAAELTAVSTAGVLAGKEIADLSVGTNGSACVLDTAGLAYCWGNNAGGLLGNGLLPNSNVPVAVVMSLALNGLTLTKISVGQSHACAVASNARVYCWGSGGNGQMGDGLNTVTNRRPVAVSVAGVLSGKSVTDVAVGEGFACVIADGAPYCWGANTNGRLGNNSNVSSNVPVAVVTTGVLSGLTATKITAGNRHACVLADGAPYCWGEGTNGRLGNAGVATSWIPVAVRTDGALAGRTITDISGRVAASTCVLADNAAYCWGAGSFGRLGNGLGADSSVPVAVSTSGALSGKTIVELDSSGAATMVRTSDGLLYEWGSRNGVTSLSPIAISLPAAWAGARTPIKASVGSSSFTVIAANTP